MLSDMVDQLPIRLASLLVLFSVERIFLPENRAFLGKRISMVQWILGQFFQGIAITAKLNTG